MDMKAFFKLSYGLYIVSSKYNMQESACVANTVTQVTASPAQLCVTLNKDNYTTHIIQESQLFNVSVLLEDVDMDTIRHFGFQSGRDVKKFEDVQYGTDVNDLKYLIKNSAATFSCRVKQTVDVGSHLMFIGEVEEAKILSDEPVLTYAAYHEKKNGTTPASAPSYVEDVEKHGWKCDVCGFIYEEDELPEDFVCPICKVDASHFHKI